MVYQDRQLPRWGSVSPKPNAVSGGRGKKQVLLTTIGACSVLTALYFWSSSSTADFQLSSPWSKLTSATTTKVADCFECNTVLGIKSGVTIAHARMPVQMMEERHDIPNQHFYADAEFDLGPKMHFEDIYKDMHPDVYGQAEFQTYVDLQKSIKNHGKIPQGGKAFWELSRYCEIALFGHMFKAEPLKSWYLVRDDDTFFFWQNILRFLKHYNANENHIFGRYAKGPRSVYAQGGAGFMISKGVMKATYGTDAQFANRFTNAYPTSPWGDELFGSAMFGNGAIGGPSTGSKATNLTRPNNGDPMMHEDGLDTLPFGPHTWYLPILSLTHMHSKEMWQMREFEKQLPQQGVAENDVRFCDLYEHFAVHYNSNMTLEAIEASHEEWIVMQDWEGAVRTQYDVDPATTWQECQKKCEANVACSSIAWIPGEKGRSACRVATKNAFMLGKSRKGAMAAYNVKRLRSTIGAMPCNDQAARESWYAKALELGHTDRVY